MVAPPSDLDFAVGVALVVVGHDVVDTSGGVGIGGGNRCYPSRAVLSDIRRLQLVRGAGSKIALDRKSTRLNSSHWE